MGAVAAVLGAIVGAIGTAAQVSYMHKQSKAAKRAEQLRRRQIEIDAQRRRRQIYRQAQIERARVMSNAASAGVDTSSPVQGSLGSIASISTGNVQYVNQSEQIGMGISLANEQASQYRADAATWGAATNTAGTLFASFGDIARKFI